MIGKQSLRHLLLLGIIWFTSALLIGIRGEFPLNDDWAFARSVHWLLNDGVFRIEHVANPLITHTIWGSLFSVLFGESYATLRASTLVMGYIGVAATYFTALEAGLGASLALGAAIALMANPLFFVLSYTYMTDVPFLSVLMIGMCFYVRAIRDGNKRDIALGTLFAVIATLNRQLGIALPIGFAVAYLMQNGIRTLRGVVASFLPLGITALVYKVFMIWLSYTGGLENETYGQRIDEITNTLGAGPAVVIFFMVKTLMATPYIGLFLLPLVALCWRDIADEVRRYPRIAAACGATGILSALFAIIFNRGVTSIGNMMGDLFLGALTLKDTYILQLPSPSMLHMPLPFWWAFNSLCAAAFAVFLFALVLLARDAFRQRGAISYPATVGVMAFVTGAAYFGAFALTTYFDRYLIPLGPLLSLVLLLRMRGERTDRRAGYAVAVGLILFSLLATHDYLSLNRVRWDALNGLLERREAVVREIDGGFEFNNSLDYDPAFVPVPGKSWWNVHDDRYLIAMRVLEGYAIHQMLPYSRWLPPGEGKLYLLRRIEETNK